MIKNNKKILTSILVCSLCVANPILTVANAMDNNGTATATENATNETATTPTESPSVRDLFIPAVDNSYISVYNEGAVKKLVNVVGEDDRAITITKQAYLLDKNIALKDYTIKSKYIFEKPINSMLDNLEITGFSINGNDLTRISDRDYDIRIKFIFEDKTSVTTENLFEGYTSESSRKVDITTVTESTESTTQNNSILLKPRKAYLDEVLANNSTKKIRIIQLENAKPVSDTELPLGIGEPILYKVNKDNDYDYTFNANQSFVSILGKDFFINKITEDTYDNFFSTYRGINSYDKSFEAVRKRYTNDKNRFKYTANMLLKTTLIDKVFSSFSNEGNLYDLKAVKKFFFDNTQLEFNANTEVTQINMFGATKSGSFFSTALEKEKDFKGVEDLWIDYFPQSKKQKFTLYSRFIVYHRGRNRLIKIYLL